MTPGSSREEEFLAKLNGIIEVNLADPQFGVDELAHKMGMSRSNLHRRVTEIAGYSVSRYIRQIRLENAKMLLTETSQTISEVSWQVGFNSISYFTKCFHDQYGFPPGEVRNKALQVIPGTTREVNEKFQVYRVNKKLFLLTSSVLLTGFILFLGAHFFVIPHNKDDGKYNAGIRTMAILPFINDSRDSSNTYFINGLMESILNNLANIDGFNVRSRTTVEKYRNSNLSLTQIANDLGVKYIVEGSGQKYGNTVVLNIQLMDAKSDRHLLSKQFTREITEVSDFIEFQKEIALQIASEIRSTVGPDDVKWYKQINTQNYVSLNYYYNGFELHKQAQLSKDPADLERKAMILLKKSLGADSSFTWPMIQLGWIYYSLYSSQEYDPVLLDSAFYFANKALSVDSTIGAGYGLLGSLYQFTGKNEKALETMLTALKYGNNEGVFRQISSLYFEKGDYTEAIRYALLQLDKDGKQTPDYWTLNTLYMQFCMTGFGKESKVFADRILAIDKDTAMYFERLLTISLIPGHPGSGFKIDPGMMERYSDSVSLILAWKSLFKRDFRDASLYCDRFIKANQFTGRSPQRISPVYAYLPVYAYITTG